MIKKMSKIDSKYNYVLKFTLGQIRARGRVARRRRGVPITSSFARKQKACRLTRPRGKRQRFFFIYFGFHF
jgi:hypothetical protein